MLSDFLAGDGEMRARMRSFPWAETPLGDIFAWPQSLRTAVALLLGSPVPMVMLWGREGIMIYNDAYSVFAGGRHPTLLGSPVLEGWPEVADFNRHVMNVGLSGGTLSFRDQQLVLHRHGRPEDVWMDLSYSPIQDESGKPAGVLAIVAETTERVLAERKVRDLNVQLEEQVHQLSELDRVKTSFFSNISHEFRTPLTLMLGPTEDALASPARTLSGGNLETLYRNELRLLKLVNALLDFSRIEAGRMVAAFEATDLCRLTTELASVFRAAVESAGLRYEVTCDEVTGPVYVDRDMWEKVVFNLLSNALKFTFEGGISVSVRDAGDFVEVAVRDTGVGIPSAEIKHVFERFHRVEGARSRTQEGSGIGLALVNDLIRLHGGTIAVDSSTGAGTTFTVRLKKGADHLPAENIATAPRQVEPVGGGAYIEEALKWLPSTRTDAPAATDATTRAHVLVVDDNADMRDYLSRLLQPHWNVRAAADGEDALRQARSDPPEVVVTDVMMPGLDGFALMRALRAEPRTAEVPVIILSARAGDEARVEGLQHGADDYLVKPFAARELIARVNTQIILSRTARERAALLEREQLARREAELQKQHLFSVFMQAPMPIVVLRGPKFIIDLANPKTCQVWSKRHDDVIGRPLVDALPELQTQVFTQLLEGVYRTGKPYVGHEVAGTLESPRGGSSRTVYFTFVYTPYRDVHGAIEGVLVVASDVTDQVLAKQTLQQAHAEADRANRAKDEFLAMLGHELRNPLAPIQTALHIMRLRGDETAQAERTIIQRQVSHLTRLVDDLLDVSRITRGKVELKCEPVEYSEVVAKAIETASPLLDQREHTLEIDVPRGLIVEADPDRLAQVVANLLTNAAKYTPRGGRIRVAATQEGHDVVLRVRDNGVGIAPDLLPNLFDVFVQGRQTIERSHGGLGLGLAIVRSLVERHGGSVAAHSEGEGKGSEFVVRLSAVAPVAVAALPPQSAASDRAEPTGIKVLVVDDNEDAADMLVAALTLKGYEPRAAHDGPEAIQAAAQFKPDVALLDIGLPVMDGYELAERLRTVAGLENVCLVAITGYGQESDRERSRRAGFQKHLVKPVDVNMLDQVIQEIA